MRESQSVFDPGDAMMERKVFARSPRSHGRGDSGTWTVNSGPVTVVSVTAVVHRELRTTSALVGSNLPFCTAKPQARDCRAACVPCFSVFDFCQRVLA
eukprot:943350-Rhodomonas_salina.1